MLISNSTPYADGYGAAAPAAAQGTDPALLKQTDNPSYVGAVNNMVRALMAGYGKYQKAHPSPTAGAGAVPGAPMPLTPPMRTPAWPPPASGAGIPYTGGGPLNTSATPNPMGMPPQMPAGQPVPFIGGGPLGTGVPPNPMTQALFSPPPASPMGGGSANAVY